MDKEQNEKYWKERFEAIEQDLFHDANISIEDIHTMLQKAFGTIDQKIAIFYQKYADNNKVTFAEAKKYLRDNERKEFQADVTDYIKMAENNADGQFNQILDALSARARITRLEALKIRIAMEIRKAYGKEDAAVNQICADAMQKAYLRTAYEVQNGVGKYEPFTQIDTKSIQRALAKPWTADGRTFSKRIWVNQNAMIQELGHELARGFITGVDSATASKIIAHGLGVSEMQAARLVLTESAYFASVGSRDSYQKMGLDQYEISATLDDRTSDICQDMDGQIFNVSEFDPGETAPPFHPYCRSTTVPVIPGNVLAGSEKRAARDENGKTYMVDGTLTYHQWKEDFVTDDEEED